MWGNKLLIFSFALLFSAISCQDVIKDLPWDTLDQKKLPDDPIIGGVPATSNNALSDKLATSVVDVSKTSGSKVFSPTDTNVKPADVPQADVAKQETDSGYKPAVVPQADLAKQETDSGYKPAVVPQADTANQETDGQYKAAVVPQADLAKQETDGDHKPAVVPQADTANQETDSQYKAAVVPQAYPVKQETDSRYNAAVVPQAHLVKQETDGDYKPAVVPQADTTKQETDSQYKAAVVPQAHLVKQETDGDYKPAVIPKADTTIQETDSQYKAAVVPQAYPVKQETDSKFKAGVVPQARPVNQETDSEYKPAVVPQADIAKQETDSNYQPGTESLNIVEKTVDNTADNTQVDNVINPVIETEPKLLNGNPNEPMIDTNIETNIETVETQAEKLVNSNVDTAARKDVSYDSVLNPSTKVESHDLMIPAETDLLKPNDILVRPPEDAFNKEEMDDNFSNVNGNANNLDEVGMVDNSKMENDAAYEESREDDIDEGNLITDYDADEESRDYMDETNLITDYDADEESRDYMDGTNLITDYDADEASEDREKIGKEWAYDNKDDYSRDDEVYDKDNGRINQNEDNFMENDEFENVLDDEFGDELNGFEDDDNNYDYADNWEKFWEDLGDDDISTDADIPQDFTRGSMSTTEGYWAEEGWDNNNEGAGKDMLESPHLFDSNIGVLGGIGGSKVNHEASTAKHWNGMKSKVAMYDEDSSAASSYSWVLMLSIIAVVFVSVVFLHKHKLEKYLYIVGLRRRPSNNGMHYVGRMSDEHKVLLENEYA